ncbi:MAG TPA: glycosyl hydrolase family 8 [Rhodopila sp.]|uniref:glycosyl hydrolase family 8 n=1 Tax=Rhodopila sp. TaxID=2480087 RepID=UPI002B63E948|nr:glycosyl hydrolase family 8 [Rhodopila sp.]HVY13839.1 glycosyl hydrolase family 8 [Rhodopila sp.]
MMLRRRILLAGLAGGPAVDCAVRGARAAPAFPVAEWESFKRRFVSPDGRVIDTGNGGVSHSEGQGWGMLFAVAAQDEATFTQIAKWTSGNLARPSDALHAWRFVPGAKRQAGDRNNATDGDIFIASALARAGRSWGQSDRLEAAAGIARDILRLLVRRIGPYTVLLPGLQGFEAKDALTVNLSYYAFPLIAELAALVPSDEWEVLVRDGRTLIDRGRFGTWKLPPDWLRIASSGALATSPGWPPRFSFDAVRVPLWNAWAGLPNRTAMVAIDRFWSGYPADRVPAWINLETGEVAPYPMTPGMLAIADILRSGLGQPPLNPPPTVDSANDYYNAALILLSAMAAEEVVTR